MTHCVQRGVERLLRAVIMLSVYAGIFGFRTWTLHSTRKAHITWLRLLGCQACSPEPHRCT